MTASAIQKQVSLLLPQLKSGEQLMVLELIKGLISEDQQTESRITLAQYNQELDEAVARLDAGLGIPHSEVVKQLSKW